jgi:cobalamin biosynthesis Mg chelatase CobN
LTLVLATSFGVQSFSQETGLKEPAFPSAPSFGTTTATVNTATPPQPDLPPELLNNGMDTATTKNSVAKNTMSQNTMSQNTTSQNGTAKTTNSSIAPFLTVKESTKTTDKTVRTGGVNLLQIALVSSLLVIGSIGFLVLKKRRISIKMQ